MRRFSFVLCAFLVLAFLLTTRHGDTPVAENAPQLKVAAADGGETSASSGSSKFFDDLLAESGKSLSEQEDEDAVSQVAASETRNAYQANDLRAIAENDDELTTQTAEAQAKAALDPQSAEKILQQPVVIPDAPRAAQEELKRLGCYTGRIDGIWGRNSRRAIQGFNRRAANDVIQQPDAAMVLILRNYPDGYCSNNCRPNSNRSECAVATDKAPGEQKVEAPGHTNNSAEASYLPPWMRGENAILVEDENAAWNGNAEGAGGEDVQTQPKAQPRRARRNLVRGKKPRAAQRPQRSRSARSDNWGLQNWPAGR